MRPRAAAVALAAALLAAGCGEEREAARGAATAVDVRVATSAAPGPGRYAARCDGAACVRRWRAWVARASDRTRACTEIYGGRETARVTGTVAGAPVDVTARRSDGCGIADYEALFALLGRRPPVATGAP